eukprot:scaffold3334_cov369-Prasinococcus_capsulatus_cf.AAC.21
MGMTPALDYIHASLASPRSVPPALVQFHAGPVKISTYCRYADAQAAAERFRAHTVGGVLQSLHEAALHLWSEARGAPAQHAAACEGLPPPVVVLHVKVVTQTMHHLPIRCANHSRQLSRAQVVLRRLQSSHHL